MTGPSTYPESAPRAQARAVLTWVLGHDDFDLEHRLAAGEALAELQAVVPADMILAPVPDTPGTLDDARRLLDDAAQPETTARGIVAVSLAQRHLRRAAPPAP
jgi:hypothetical protein